MASTFLPRDVSAEKAVARLRFLAAIAVSIGAVAILMQEPTAVGATLSIAAFLIALGWTAHFWRTRSLPTGDGLRFDDEGVHIRLGARDEAISWQDVQRVAVNEERLRIELSRTGAEPFLIPMAFAGRSLPELHQELDRLFDDATG